MLSLVSNISATQAVEAKYSADFDGTDDYIDTGQNFSSVFNDSFSISFWAKPDDGQPASVEYFFGENDNDDDILRGQLETNGDFRLILEGDTDTGSFRTSSPVFSDGAATSWTHILVSVTKPGSGNSSAVIYINGSSVSHATSNIAHDNHAAFSSAQNLVIGARNNKGTIMDFYSGGMDEWALWNVALDADAAAAIYNNGSPLNLKFDQGNYDNSSALQAYYRMGNGSFDDKAKGIVHDQDNPGFGSNLVTNGHFDVNTSGWSDGSSRYIHSLTWEKDCLYFCSVDLYLVSGKFRMDGADTAVIGAGTGSDNNIIGIETYDAAIDDRWRTVTGYAIGVATGNTDELWIRSFGTSSGKSITQGTFGGRSGVARFVFNDTGEFYIDNVSVKKINGKPGLTSGGVTFSSDNP